MVEISEKIGGEAGDELNKEDVEKRDIANKNRREILRRIVCIMLGFIVVSVDSFLIILLISFFAGFKFTDNLLGCQRV